MKRIVVILGDEVALGKGCPKGQGFAARVQDSLEQHGVEVHNWSREEHTATGCATDYFQEIQDNIRRLDAGPHVRAVVVLELGIHDRVFLGDMLHTGLSTLCTLCAQEGVQPVIMQVVPDDADVHVAEETNSRLVRAPTSALMQWQREPSAPFYPHADVHKDLAANLLEVLQEELNLPLAAHGRDPMMSGNFRSTHSDPLRSGGLGAGQLDGVWLHKADPDLMEVIENDVIRSPDGSSTMLRKGTNANMHYIEAGGRRVTCKTVGNELHWDDGDIWCLVEDKAPTLGSPPGRKKKADMRSLRKAWDDAEEAFYRTKKEEEREELKHERERLRHERDLLSEARARLQAGESRLHEDTEKLTAMRTGAR